LYTKGDEVCKPVHIAVDKHNFYLGAHKIKFICEWADFGDKVTPHSGSEEHSFATWSRPGSGTKRLYIDDGDGTASEGD
jgi:hypothetical protein